ncbi:PilX N-terminal domain-containing protein [Desulfonema limicola]|uniref:PilX N-terminal domain-containing protein n=1 Tax=Desulfonema limicola TaxID=45656 RepID=A0A975BDH3_9BACT|nr:pilus assembly PilX N-terminal domain-containing protein [Desulfonema limicola]QTA83200.1 PilX N-terminal domain-containing protein [Desulfonema limicola]
MKPRFTQISKNERGAALLMTMVMLVILTLIGTAATKTSTLEIMMSGSAKNKKAAFYTAEAGIEHAKKIIDDLGFDSGTAKWKIDGIEDADSYDSSVILKTSAGELISDKALGDYAYTIKVWDSGRLHIRSEAKGVNNKSKSAIEVIYSNKEEEWLKEDGGYVAQAGHNEQKSFSDQLDDKEAMDSFEKQL